MSITTPNEALDWLLNSSKNLLDDTTSIFQNKTSFKIRVLTEPYALAGPATLSDGGDSKKLSEEGVESKFVFKGRILDREMAHQKFLQDPCDSSLFGGDKTKLNLLINDHASIVLNVASDIAGFGVGDIIIGEAEPGDNNNLYDLQILTMTEISDVFKDSNTNSKFSDCSELGDIFSGWGGDILTDLSLPDISSEPVIIEDGPCENSFDLMHPFGPAGENVPRTSQFNEKRSPTTNPHSGTDYGAAYMPLYAVYSGEVISTLNKCKDSSAAVALLQQYDSDRWNNPTEENGGPVESVALGARGEFGDDIPEYFYCIVDGYEYGSGGNSVVIKLDKEWDSYFVYYGHMRDVAVQVGQKLQQGDFIGNSGNSGFTTGPHLHIELWQGDASNKQDIYPYIKTYNKCQTQN